MMDLFSLFSGLKSGRQEEEMDAFRKPTLSHPVKT